MGGGKLNQKLTKKHRTIQGELHVSSLSHLRPPRKRGMRSDHTGASLSGEQKKSNQTNDREAASVGRVAARDRRFDGPTTRDSR